MFTFRRSITALAFIVATSASASAAPILINTVLTGDPRPSNPDNLRVNVSILGDTTSNLAVWNVDLDMATTHPNARLDEFGFNLVGSASNYTFTWLSLPYTRTSGTLNGSGGSSFLLTLDDPNGNQYDATNSRTLSFSVRRNTGNFTLADFQSAPASCSNDSLLGCYQLGAHLQALTGGSGSGVATGRYTPPPQTSVPEPGSLLLMAVGLAAGAGLRKKK